MMPPLIIGENWRRTTRTDIRHRIIKAVKRVASESYVRWKKSRHGHWERRERCQAGKKRGRLGFCERILRGRKGEVGFLGAIAKGGILGGGGR
jgi:hypothetical protein